MEKETARKIWTDVTDEKTLQSGDIDATYKTEFDLGKATLFNLPSFHMNASFLADQPITKEDNKDSANVGIGGDANPTPIGYQQTENVSWENKSSSTVSLPSEGSDSRYEIQEEIARGGMGVVYRGVQKSLQREIAIKKILGERNETQSQKFIAESIITAYLDHPNIVPVHELGIGQDGDVMLTMKLIDGMEWKELLKQDSEQPNYLQKHLKILLGVCNAISFAHSKGIIHNDLKPSNVMVGGFGEVLVMDWGLAVNFFDSHPSPFIPHRSHVNSPMGTPSYMPYELAEGLGDELAPQTDVYLLGAILYHILMKRPPRIGSPISGIVAAMEGTLPEFDNSVPREMQEICLKAMAKNIEDRYSTVAKFQEAVEGFLQHRESIVIAQQAENILNECADDTFVNGDPSATQQSILYDKFARSISGFQQSLQLWPENQAAAKKEHEARLKYAKAAINNLDLGLAKAQLLQMDQEHSETKDLQKKLTNARELKINRSVSLGLSQISLGKVAIFSNLFLFEFIHRQASGAWFTTEQLSISGIMMALSIVVFGFTFISERFSLRNLLLAASTFEIIGAFLICTAFCSSNVTEPMASGLLWSAGWIALFRIEVQHPPLSAALTGVIAATAAVFAFYLASEGKATTEVWAFILVEHYAVAVAGTFGAYRISKSYRGK